MEILIPSHEGGDDDDDDDDDKAEAKVLKRFDILTAARDNDKQGLERLLQEDAELLETSIFFDETPLFTAARYGHDELVAYLLDQGAKMEAKNGSHENVVYCACQSGHVKVVTLLLARCEPNVDTSMAVIRACEEGHAEVLRLLLAGRQCLDETQPGYLHLGNSCVKKDHGWTALHYACGDPTTECVRLLLGSGADPCIPADTGLTPLMVVSRAGLSDVVRVFLDHKHARCKSKDGGGCCNLNATDREGFTALYWSYRLTHIGISGLLLRAGADPSITHGYAQADGSPALTAFEAAREQGNRPYVELFKV